MEFIYKNDELLPSNSDRPTYLQDNIKGEIFHRSYIDYLHLGYSHHYGIEVKPDYIWFTILNEISRAVKANPNQYRSIFTDSEDKKDVKVPTLDPVVMPVENLLKAVFALIPSGLEKEHVVLEFTTTTNGARIAFSTAFLEAASPYYTYAMYLCGYNKIKVLGTVEDYDKMREAASTLSTIFYGTQLEGYLTKVVKLIEVIIFNFEQSEFWKDIYSFERCGSGGQKEVQGWFSQFFDDFPSNRFINCFPPHISTIEYKNLSTGASYKMQTGILSSKIEDGYLVTDFEMGINEIV